MLQIHIANGLPAMAIVGLADMAVGKSRERVRAAWAKGLSIIAPPGLTGLVNHIHGRQVLHPPTPKMAPARQNMPDLADLKGQNMARRVLENATAGGHHLLMVCPHGAGKSMLASQLAGLLPLPSLAEMPEVTMLHSVAGNLTAGGLIQNRTFREPHHSASMAALVSGGLRARLVKFLW